MNTVFEAVVGPDATIIEAIRLMGASPGNRGIAGIAVVIDADGKVIGVLTDGDVRRGLARGKSLGDPVVALANPAPFLLPHDISPSAMRRRALMEARHGQGDHLAFDKLVLVDDEGRLRNVIRLSELINQPVESKKIAVYGLGFVGLTLACTMANAGLSVLGIEKKQAVAQSLKAGRPHFYENGLEALLQTVLSEGAFSIAGVGEAEIDADVHVVCVGPTISGASEPDFAALVEVCEGIRTRLAPSNLVIVRATVPVGTSRDIVLPILERSGLKGGADFHLAFAPERTVEGEALEELRTLPQVVGGVSDECRRQAGELFRTITSSIVEAASLEAAELVKLVNNTYRDLIFSFANEVASICESFNLNAFDLIRSANDGYVRDPIPSPSPGVGGFCLTKDPFLYSHPRTSVRPQLGLLSREINSRGVSVVRNKLLEYCRRTGKDLSVLRILIIGVAFKGRPDTSDLRKSVAVDLIDALPARENIRVLDFVVPGEDLAALNVEVATDRYAAFEGADAVLVMNNNVQNNRLNIAEAIHRANSPLLFFDGWDLFDGREIERIDGVFYATMGYMSRWHAESL